jgi:hypothetical protein
MQASYVAVRMLQTFPKIENYDTRGWSEMLGLALSNENGVMVGLMRSEGD